MGTDIPVDPEESIDPEGLVDLEDPTGPEKPDNDNDKDEVVIVQDKDDGNGDRRPSTASNIFNILGLGDILFIVGLGFIIILRRRFIAN